MAPAAKYQLIARAQIAERHKRLSSHVHGDFGKPALLTAEVLPIIYVTGEPRQPDPNRHHGVTDIAVIPTRGWIDDVGQASRQPSSKVSPCAFADELQRLCPGRQGCASGKYPTDSGCTPELIVQTCRETAISARQPETSITRSLTDCTHDGLG